MNKPLPRAILFILLFFCFDQFIYRIYKYENYDRPYTYGSLSRLYSGTINTDIVMFGSSRTLLHLNPATIEKNTHLTAYNLAMDGTNIEQSIFTLEEYLLHNRKPQLILFEADLNQLDKKNKFLRFERKKFKEYCYLSEHTSRLYNFSVLQKLSHSIVKSQFAANNPYVFYSFFTRSIFGKKEKERRYKDFGDWIFSEGACLKKGTILESEIKKFDYLLEPSQERIKQFLHIASYANDKKIPLLFFSPPVSYWKKNPSMEKGIAYFRNLANQFDYIAYADYSFDDEFRTNAHLWWNSAHLNIDGAHLLSQKVSEAINGLHFPGFGISHHQHQDVRQMVSIGSK